MRQSRTISGWTRKFSVFAPITVPKTSANSTPADIGSGEGTTMIDPLRTTEDVRDTIDQSTGVVSETIVITCGDAAEFTIPVGTVAMVNGRPVTDSLPAGLCR